MMSRSDEGHENGARLSSLGPSMMIHAKRSEISGTLINGLELNIDGVRIKLNFEKDRPIDQVFGPQMATAVREIAKKASTEKGLLSLPDLHLAFEGCQIDGATVLSNIYAKHVSAITIRIRKLQGNVLRLLRPGLLCDDETTQALERTVDDAIERIYMPLRNFEHSIDSALNELSHGMAERLHAQIIAFRTEIDNVCYNFERLLADDLERAKVEQRLEQDRGRLGDARDTAHIPAPHLRIVPNTARDDMI